MLYANVLFVLTVLKNNIVIETFPSLIHLYFLRNLSLQKVCFRRKTAPTPSEIWNDSITLAQFLKYLG